jgi:hypothetical protein
VAEVDGTTARYRLLDTTRAYALEKLTESGEYGPVARRLAEYGRDVLERTETRFERRPSDEQATDYRLIDNLRAALDWAFSPDGDASIGVALTTAAVPLWMHLSLLEECRSRVEQPLAAMEVGTDPDAPREMKLHAALGALLMHTKDAVPAAGAAWMRPSRLPRALTMPNTGWSRSGVCGSFTWQTGGIAWRWKWRRGSVPWRRTGRTRTIGSSASA